MTLFIIIFVDWIIEIWKQKSCLFIFALFQNEIFVFLFFFLSLILLNLFFNKRKFRFYLIFILNFSLILFFAFTIYFPFNHAKNFYEMQNVGLKINNCIANYRKTTEKYPIDLSVLDKNCLDSNDMKLIGKYFKYETYNFQNRYALIFFPPGIQYTIYVITEIDSNFTKID
jgi:energy-coupling factor transporter transmembrane protein EcfT